MGELVLMFFNPVKQPLGDQACIYFLFYFFIIKYFFFKHKFTMKERRKEMFYLMTHSTHFIYIIWRQTYGRSEM